MPLTETPITTPSRVPKKLDELKSKQRAVERRQKEWTNQIVDFAAECEDEAQLRSVLKSLSRVQIPANIMAMITKTPQEEGAKNLIQGNMEHSAVACKAVLKKAFGMAKNLKDLNQIMACDYRIAAKLEDDENPSVADGSLLYGLEEALADTLENNQAIRAEIVEARMPGHNTNEAFLHFLYFIKEVEAFEKLAPVLLELQTKAFGEQVENIVQLYR